MTTKETILNVVAATVHQFDPEAHIILYGSQARGNSHKESDWDFLVVTNKEVQSSAFKKNLRRALYFVEVQHSIVISALIKDRKWLQDMAETPFCKEIKKDGLVIV